jgi:uncharacterized metal-binding protein YceD (DUF177 family)
MKALIIGAAGLVMLGGCAAITERTGLTVDQQVCIGKTAAEVIQSDTDMTSQAKVLFIAETCEIDLNKLVNDAINTALVAAEVAD